MKFYNSGSTIGLSISDPWVMLLVIYGVLEIISITTSRIPILYKVFLYFRVRSKVNEILPLWWKIKEVSLITMAYRCGHIECYVAVVSRISKQTQSGSYTSWANDHIQIDWLGNILKSEIKENIGRLDERIGIADSAKQYVRNRTLSKLGIK